MEHANTRILIVDDEVDNCANLADVFSDLGYEVDVAYSGQAALELIQQQQYAVALLDLKMPGMSGLELYKQLREISSGTVAIVVTAYASGDTARQVLEAGAWQILPKPVDFNRLLTLVAEASEQPLILLVDDDHELCDTLWELFREHRYRITCAHDVPAALQAIQSQKLELAVVDLRLGEGSGTEVLKALHQHIPPVRSILISGYRNELSRLAEADPAEQPDAICHKPFDVGELLKTVDRLAQKQSSGPAGDVA